MRRRAAGRSSDSRWAETAAASRRNVRPPSTTQVAAAVNAVRAVGERRVARSASTPTPTAAATRAAVCRAPAARESR